MKRLLALLAIHTLLGSSYYCSTQIGLRTDGSLEVLIESPQPPAYEAVGRSLYSQDGAKLLVTSITHERGAEGIRHIIRASVRGTHRYALQLFPTRMVHSFSMDRKAVERTLLEAAGIPQGEFVATNRQWEIIQ